MLSYSRHAAYFLYALPFLFDLLGKAVMMSAIKSTRCAFLLLTAGLFLATPLRAQDASKVDATFQTFWAAKSPAEAERTVHSIIKSGVTFDEAFRRLKAGRTYTAQKTGIIVLR